MKKGMPRPSFYVDETGPGYKGNWNNQRYPLAYTSEENNISLISDVRAKECVKNQLCFVCGLKVEGMPWALAKGQEIYLDHGEAGPFHELCIEITMKRCPHVAESPLYFAVQVDWDELDECRNMW